MRARPGAANLTPTVAQAVSMDSFPACDYHLEQFGECVSAHFVGITIFETHAFMCASCFNLYGMGLGPSKGQILMMGA
jgi:hypothetical protein